MQEVQQEALGAVTYWSLAPVFDRGRLAQDLEGLPVTLPEQRRPISALREALAQAYPECLIRSTKRRAELEVVREYKGEGQNSYAHIASASVNGELHIEPINHDVPAYYRKAMTTLSQQQVCAALVDALNGYSLGGVLLRPAGGIYWVPERSLEVWGRIAGALEQQVSSIYILRTPKNAQTLRAVQDSIVETSEERVRALAKELTDRLEGTPTLAGLESLAAQAEAVRTKVQEYEKILGAGLEASKAQVEQLEVAIRQARMLAAAHVEGGGV